MSITSPVTLLLAGALAGPEIYRAVAGEVDLSDAALRFLICVPIAALMLAVLRGLTRDYGKPRRRAEDRAGEPVAEPDVVQADRP